MTRRLKNPRESRNSKAKTRYRGGGGHPPKINPAPLSLLTFYKLWREGNHRIPRSDAPGFRRLKKWQRNAIRRWKRQAPRFTVPVAQQDINPA